MMVGQGDGILPGGMPPGRLAGDLGGGTPAQFGVRPDVVVIVPPGVEHEAGMGQRREQRLIEAFVPHTPVDGVDGPCTRHRCAIVVAVFVHFKQEPSTYRLALLASTSPSRFSRFTRQMPRVAGSPKCAFAGLRCSTTSESFHPASSACHWARELIAIGHEVKLTPPAYVKPYAKRNKTDAADAGAIAEAVTRFGSQRNAQQQARRVSKVCRNDARPRSSSSL